VRDPFSQPSIVVEAVHRISCSAADTALVRHTAQVMHPVPAPVWNHNWIAVWYMALHEGLQVEVSRCCFLAES